MGLLVGLGPAYAGGGGGTGGNTGGGEGGAQLIAYSADDAVMTAVGSVELGYGTDLTRFFNSMKNLRKVGAFDTSKVVTFNYMFEYSGLQELPDFDYSEGLNFNGYLSGCTSLENIPPMTLPKATVVTSMFNNCSKVSRIEIKCPCATNLMSMFNNCVNLKSVKIEAGTITTIRNAFLGCVALETVENILDISTTTTTTYAFKDCTALVNCYLRGLRTGISFEFSPALSKDSVLFLFENAQAVDTAQSITLHADVFGQLSAEEIAVATGKGFSVVSA